MIPVQACSHLWQQQPLQTPRHSFRQLDQNTVSVRYRARPENLDEAISAFCELITPPKANSLEDSQSTSIAQENKKINLACSLLLQEDFVELV